MLSKVKEKQLKPLLEENEQGLAMLDACSKNIKKLSDVLEKLPKFDYSDEEFEDKDIFNKKFIDEDWEIALLVYPELEKKKILLAKDDPNNPEVVVQGYGRLSMNGLKRDVTDMLNGLAEFAERDDWERLEYEISKGTFMPKLNALVKALEDLESVRKKGGPQSRGITKR